MSLISNKGGVLVPAGAGGDLHFVAALTNPDLTLSNDNQTVANLTTDEKIGAVGNSPQTVGKIYIELVIDVTTGNNMSTGAANDTYNNTVGIDQIGGFCHRISNRAFCDSQSTDTNGPSIFDGDTINIAFNLVGDATSKFWVGVNGTWLEADKSGNPGDPANNLFEICQEDFTEIRPAWSSGNNGPGGTCTIRQIPFYTVPAGFIYWPPSPDD